MAKRKGVSWTEEEVREISDLLTKGYYTLKEVSEIYERTLSGVRSRLNSEGITTLKMPAELKIRTNRPWSKEEKHKILDELREGVSIEVVSKKYNRSVEAVGQYLRTQNYSMVTFQKNRKSKHQQARDVRKLKLTEGKEYRILLGDQRRNDAVNYIATCIKNYKDYVHFKKDNGVSECFLKIDMFNNSNMIKEI